RAPFAADVEHRRSAERGGQGEAALQRVDARELPAAQQQIGHRIPRVAKAPAAAERQLPDIARHEAVRDVELGRPAIGLEVVTVLWLAKRAGIDAGAAAARR